MVKNLPAMWETRVQSLGWEVPLLYLFKVRIITVWASLVAETVKNPPATQKTQVPSLGQEDSLEEGIATQRSLLAWRIPRTEGAWRATVHGVTKSWTGLNDFHWRTGNRYSQKKRCTEASIAPSSQEEGRTDAHDRGLVNGHTPRAVCTEPRAGPQRE